MISHTAGFANMMHPSGQKKYIPHDSSRNSWRKDPSPVGDEVAWWRILVARLDARSGSGSATYHLAHDLAPLPQRRVPVKYGADGLSLKGVNGSQPSSGSSSFYQG